MRYFGKFTFVSHLDEMDTVFNFIPVNCFCLGSLTNDEIEVVEFPTKTVIYVDTVLLNFGIL